MRLVIQRVNQASVAVEGAEVATIGPGFLVLVGVGREDDESDAVWLAEKTVNLRVFADDAGKLNLSLLETGGELLAVSQFTLLGDCRRGRRPSFSSAAPPDLGLRLYERYVDACREFGVRVETGKFGAHMQVQLTNDGPVTLILDSRAG